MLLWDKKHITKSKQFVNAKSTMSSYKQYFGSAEYLGFSSFFADDTDNTSLSKSSYPSSRRIHSLGSPSSLTRLCRQNPVSFVSNNLAEPMTELYPRTGVQSAIALC
ncbi:hypothetical protein ACMFMF_003566 [Clarireedia jacksonii]